jgi:hypothetical protein
MDSTDLTSDLVLRTPYTQLIPVSSQTAHQSEAKQILCRGATETSNPNPTFQLTPGVSKVGSGRAGDIARYRLPESKNKCVVLSNLPVPSHSFSLLLPNFHELQFFRRERELVRLHQHMQAPQ